MSSKPLTDQEDNMALYRAFACVTSFVMPTFVCVLAAVAPISVQCALTVACVSARSVFDCPVLSRCPPKYANASSVCDCPVSGCHWNVLTMVLPCIMCAPRTKHLS